MTTFRPDGLWGFLTGRIRHALPTGVHLNDGLHLGVPRRVLIRANGTGSLTFTDGETIELPALRIEDGAA